MKYIISVVDVYGKQVYYAVDVSEANVLMALRELKRDYKGCRVIAEIM